MIKENSEEMKWLLRPSEVLYMAEAQMKRLEKELERCIVRRDRQILERYRRLVSI